MGNEFSGREPHPLFLAIQTYEVGLELLLKSHSEERVKRSHEVKILSMKTASPKPF